MQEEIMTSEYRQFLTKVLDSNPSLLSPEVMDFFSECMAMTRLYAIKNADYGNSFEKGMDDIGDAYGIGRLYDKMNRLINVSKNGNQVKEETTFDTVRDLACYAVMLLNVWTKRAEKR